MTIHLRKMTDAEFAPWRETAQAEYAQNRETEGLTPENARALAEKSFSELLPQGPSTPDQHLYRIVEEAGGRPVGVFWWGIQKQGEERLAWVYDIRVEEAERGRGYGRAAMLAGEAEVRARGIRRFGLHVFGFNHPARGLYRSLGFEEKNVIMYKDLSASSAP